MNFNKLNYDGYDDWLKIEELCSRCHLKPVVHTVRGKWLCEDCTKEVSAAERAERKIARERIRVREALQAIINEPKA